LHKVPKAPTNIQLFFFVLQKLYKLFAWGTYIQKHPFYDCLVTLTPSISSHMPHAERDVTPTTTTTTKTSSTMGEPLTNGEKQHSRVLSHLTSYPVVSDTLNLYTSNPYGKKSITFAQDAYSRFGAPLLPYLQGPYSFVAPYVDRADVYADDGLNKVEQRFPIVKEDTDKIKGTVVDYAFFPLRLAGQGRQYLVETFNDELSKTEGEGGLVKLAKATVSTELKVGVDAYHFLAKWLARGQESAQAKKDEKLNN
jgi:hypothetical protein